jgi:hypothetical protein
VNPTDNVMTGNVGFRDQAGQAATVTIGGQSGSIFSYTIAARSSQKLQTSGVSASPIAGSVRVVPAANGFAPSGVSIFSFQNAGTTVAEAGVPAVAADTAFRVYAEASGNFAQGAVGSIQTGFAVSNLSGSAASVTVELSTLNGSSTGLVGTLTIPSNGQSAIFLSQIPGLGSLPVPFQGVLRVSSSASISVVALRGRYNERKDFLITTVPPVSETAQPRPVPRCILPAHCRLRRLRNSVHSVQRPRGPAFVGRPDVFQAIRMRVDPVDSIIGVAGPALRPCSFRLQLHDPEGILKGLDSLTRVPPSDTQP